MDLKIGENIRKYRRERELSQEMLAERLGVSFQAVSKWERGETYPDVTMLPAIASFFEISVDTLLGMQEVRESEEVAAILKEHYEYDTHYDSEGSIRVLEEGLKKYPNNFKLLTAYAYSIQNKNPEKCVELCHYILEHCKEQGLRNRAQSDLCYGYFKSGNKEKAIECAKQLPSYYNSREDALRHFLSGKERKDYIQGEIIHTLAYEFWLSIRKMMEEYTPEEQIELYRKSNAVYDAIYETDDVPLKLTRKMRNFQGIAEVCLQNGWIDEGYSAMRDAAECARIHDALPPVVTSKALLFNFQPYDRKWESKPYLKLCKTLLSDFETEDEFYANIRESAEYHEIVNSLKM